jgi:hypothetical protein
LLTDGLWMISLVMCSFWPGYARRASYAICTARSTPQQYPYASASFTVTSPCSHAFTSLPAVTKGSVCLPQRFRLNFVWPSNPMLGGCTDVFIFTLRHPSETAH